MIDENELRFYAEYYAYQMCGSGPCEDCDNFRHLQNNIEFEEFSDCIINARCDEAKEYNTKYNNYIKEYLKKYGINN